MSDTETHMIPAETSITQGLSSLPCVAITISTVLLWCRWTGGLWPEQFPVGPENYADGPSQDHHQQLHCPLFCSLVLYHQENSNLKIIEWVEWLTLGVAHKLSRYSVGICLCASFLSKYWLRDRLRGLPTKFVCNFNLVKAI